MATPPTGITSPCLSPSLLAAYRALAPPARIFPQPAQQHEHSLTRINLLLNWVQVGVAKDLLQAPPVHDVAVGAEEGAGTAVGGRARHAGAVAAVVAYQDDVPVLCE